MHKPQAIWTDAEIDRMRRMAAKGLRGPQIAKLLGRTAHSVRGKAKPLGIKLTRGGPKGDRSETARMERGSERLREAIKALLGQMDQGTITACLCPQAPTIPGTERIYKTASIERLAA